MDLRLKPERGNRILRVPLRALATFTVPWIRLKSQDNERKTDKNSTLKKIQVMIGEISSLVLFWSWVQLSEWQSLPLEEMRDWSWRMSIQKKREETQSYILKLLSCTAATFMPKFKYFNRSKWPKSHYTLTFEMLKLKKAPRIHLSTSHWSCCSVLFKAD